MADYYYNRSSTNYNTKGRFGARFQSWDMAHGGKKDDADAWSNSAVLDKGDRCSDRVCPPGILGSKEEPPKVSEFTYSVQNAACGERRMGFPEGMFQHPVEKNRNGYGSYESSIDTSTNGWKKPGNGYAADAVVQEHVMVPGWSAQPGYNGWAAPNSYGTPLGRATNDIGTAVNYMKGSPARPPPVTMTRMDPWSSGTYATLQNSSPSGAKPTIDSTEAAKKYNGHFL